MKSSFLQKYEPKGFMLCVWHSTGQKSLQYLVHIVGEKKLTHSEIYWPLHDGTCILVLKIVLTYFVKNFCNFEARKIWNL